MDQTVPQMTIVCMIISSIVGFAIPIVLFLYFRFKMKADIFPFFAGCLVMLVFAMILEPGVHQIVLGSSVGGRIQNNVWLYGLYGGLMAGLFEETGRLLAFKSILRSHSGNDANALMYGAGHGGLESVVILGVSMISNIAVAFMVNNGTISEFTDPLTGDALARAEAGIAALTTTGSLAFLLGALERIFAVTLQIALSVLVWFAVNGSGRMSLYLAAILIHFFIDAAAVILSGFDIPLLAIEAVIGILTAGTAVFAKRVWDTEHQKNRTE